MTVFVRLNCSVGRAAGLYCRAALQDAVFTWSVLQGCATEWLGKRFFLGAMLRGCVSDLLRESRRSQDEPRGAKMNQEEPRGARESQEEPRGTKSSQDEPGGARRNHEEPEGGRMSAGQRRGVKRS
jgi:hypothetical protein